MDDIVAAAMLKWPNVPACTGWLGLDARGEWFMRDETAQASGDFQSACAAATGGPAKGSRLAHAGLIAFIGRNYAPDDTGSWYFQNGPQRVYVELAVTPWVWRVDAAGCVRSHTGLQATEVLGSCVDEAGRFYLQTNLGLGLVHTQDMVLAADHVLRDHWVPVNVSAATLPRKYGYVLSPGASQQQSPTGVRRMPPA